MLELDDIEYDISNLIDLLYDVNFTDKDIHTSIDRSLSTDGRKSINSSEMFKFARTSNNKYETEMKEQNYYFKESQELIGTQSCNDDCLIHNDFNLRGVILNELLLTLSHLVENEEDENDFTSLMLIPNDTILKILKYLKVLCSDPEEYEKSEELYFITFFRHEVNAICEDSERLFKTADLRMNSEMQSNQDDNNEEASNKTVRRTLTGSPRGENEEKKDTWSDENIEAKNY